MAAMVDAVECERYSDAVDAIYATVDAPACWTEALTAIAACFGDLGTILVFPRGDGNFGSIVAPALERARLAFETSEWRDKDIRFMRAAERGYVDEGRVFTDRDVMSAEEIEDHPFYAGFLADHGLRWFMAINPSPMPHLPIALSVQRSKEKTAFSDEELTTMTRLGAHARRALALSVRLLETRTADSHRLAPGLDPSRAAGVIHETGVPPDSDLAAMLVRLASG